jgi:Fe-S-cluster-containing dehydrogenase component
MKPGWSRRQILGKLGTALAGLSTWAVVRPAKAAVQQVLVSTTAPQGYDVTKHRWLLAIDIDRCLGCGHCVEACKRENQVPEGPYFRTWVERYLVKRPTPGSGDTRGEVIVESVNGGMRRQGTEDYPVTVTQVAKEEILRGFYVPKLCNLCEHSPCSQVCPVGATFDTPDGAVLVDYNYCIGCGFCIQACPYGCRFLNPIRKTAEKCTLCYHRITRGLKPACVEVCPGGARVFGDLRDPAPDNPIQRFYETRKAQPLKAHLGTKPRVQYAGLDTEVR